MEAIKPTAIKSPEWYAENSTFLSPEPPKPTLLEKLIFIAIKICTLGFFPKRAKKNQRLSAQAYMARVQSIADEASKKAYDFIGIDQKQVSEIAPVVILDTAKYQTCTNDKIRAEHKFDVANDQMYASDYALTACYFGKSQLYFYQSYFSMTANAVKDYASEYFYDDILTVQIEHEEYVENETMEMLEEAGGIGGKIGGKLFSKFKSKSKLLQTVSAVTEKKVESDSFKVITIAGNTGVTGYFSNDPKVRASIYGLVNQIRERRNNQVVQLKK